jgi:hypothetical protein
MKNINKPDTNKKPAINRMAFFFVITLTVSMATKAFANHNVCTLRAGNDLVWVRIFDVDQGGNIKHDYSSGYYARKILWRGMLKKGESYQVRSSSGEINYYYQTSTEDRRYGGNITSCSHGELITVP